MNLKVLGGISILCILSIVTNHYVLDWKTITSKKVEDHFDRLIQLQQEDLDAWSEGNDLNPSFQKRKYCNSEIDEWNDNKPWIETELQKDLYISENSSGVYLVRSSFKIDSCTLYSIYPLTRTYSITNRYLKSRANVLLPKNLSGLSSKGGDFNYRDLFFYNVNGSPSKAIDTIAGLAIIICFLIVVFHFLTGNFLITVGIVFGLRALSLWVDLLENFFRYPLFDPLYYTSSDWNPTLGDLLLNCLLIFLTILAWSRTFRVQENKKWKYEIYAYGIVGSALTMSIFSTIWSVLDNSQISLDVGESIEFGLLRILGYLSISLLVASQFLLSFRFVGCLNNEEKPLRIIGVLIAMNTLIAPISIVSSIMGLSFVALALIAHKFRWGNRLKEFKYENLQFALITSVSLALALSLSVYKFHEKDELDSKRKFANHLLIKRDVLGEYYLNQLLEEITNTNLNQLSTEELIEKINEELLNAYFDKYEIEVRDSSMDSLAYQTMVQAISNSEKSDYEDIYFVDEGTNFKYLCKVEDILLSLRLKRRVPTSVFPALLTDSKYFTASDDFDYAVFKSGEILFQRSKFGQGEWPDIEDFSNPELFHEGIEKNERHYYGVNTVDGRVILIISKKYGRRMQITNFSFFFLLNLFFTGAIVLLSSLNFKEAKLNFTGKIQLYLGLAFIIPLFSAGFALLSSLNTSYKEEINRNYLKRSLYISELLTSSFSSSITEVSSERLANIRDIIQADVSLYDSKGRLVVSSQNEIYDLGLQSALINPVVFNELIAKDNQSMIAEESIGGLDYKVSYATLDDKEGDVVGFLAMPFFDSKNHLKRQQLEVFGSLVSIFGSIFIFAILLGQLVLNNLLMPLRMVAGKIREITLQEENKPILYESSDEIGSLVRDYNYMLVKLEQSKQALARSQKETAWKEIARQVAHEIKNPLTPMQLKIQQLMRKYEEGSKDRETLSALLTQVDTLSQIAGSFSAFAEMPAPNNTRFDLGKVVANVVSLYQSDEISIEASIEEQVLIEADKDIFQRIIGNIVLNAIQSVVDEKPKLEVSLVRKGNKCELAVSDNGKGISDELRDKIFLRYFSTKSKGSGIGLALAKKGIENAGGNIWFESKDKGTTFFISMPLADS